IGAICRSRAQDRQCSHVCGVWRAGYRSRYPCGAGSEATGILPMERFRFRGRKDIDEKDTEGRMEHFPSSFYIFWKVSLQSGKSQLPKMPFIDSMQRRQKANAKGKKESGIEKMTGSKLLPVIFRL